MSSQPSACTHPRPRRRCPGAHSRAWSGSGRAQTQPGPIQTRSGLRQGPLTQLRPLRCTHGLCGPSVSVAERTRSRSHPLGLYTFTARISKRTVRRRSTLKPRLVKSRPVSLVAETSGQACLCVLRTGKADPPLVPSAPASGHQARPEHRQTANRNKKSQKPIATKVNRTQANPCPRKKASNANAQQQLARHALARGPWVAAQRWRCVATVRFQHAVAITAREYVWVTRAGGTHACNLRCSTRRASSPGRAWPACAAWRRATGPTPASRWSARRR